MKSAHKIDSRPINISLVEKIIGDKLKISLSSSTKEGIKTCRSYLNKKLSESDKSFYGINTGFGSLCNTRISNDDLGQLQKNLVLSHACGMGDEISEELARLILYLKIRNLSYGFSGVRLELVQQLIELYNKGITPIIYELGSLGASGDLAPLAHLSLALLGEGSVRLNGKKISAKAGLKKVGLNPMALKAKEGLALLNGTQFSLAFGLWTIHHATRLYHLSNIITSISMDAYLCDYSPMDGNIHKIRGQKGQIETARIIRQHLKGSGFSKLKKTTVQDPYSFRCVPQVHGATKDTLDYVTTIFEREMNAVTDNPNVFPDKDKILTGGNFHAQPLALALDFLSISVSELGSISERRTYKLINGDRGLPDFLVANPGLNSGYMITQYTAASIVSQNKQLCSPSSVDSIVSSKGQEDHVSMAANAGTKCKRVVQNVYRLLAIELCAASQAIEFRRPLKSSPQLEAFLRKFKKEVKFLKEDRLMHDDMIKAENFLKEVNV